MFTYLLQKNTPQEYSDGRDAEGKVWGKEHGTSMPYLDLPSSQHLHTFTNQEAHQTSLFKSFHRVKSSALQPSPSQRSVDGAEISNPLITWSLW